MIHNLPEQAGTSVSERLAKDMASVSTMVKDIMRIYATLSKSFRLWKKCHDDDDLGFRARRLLGHMALKKARKVQASDSHS